MATVRSTLIANGITKAGRKGQSVTLTTQFDDILRDITKEPCWIPLPYLDSVVDGQSTITLPANFRGRDYFIMDTATGGSPIAMGWREPVDFFRYTKTMTSTEENRPRIYTIRKVHNLLYFYPTADTTYTYELSYSAFHPKSGLTLAFTSGGVYQMKAGDVITGATSGVTATLTYVHRTSGTWAAGSAAGTLIFASDSGVFQAENLNVGANTNVATIAGDSTTADNFQHFLGDDFEEVIELGLAWKCSELISDLRERAPYWEDQYRKSLEDVYSAYGQTTVKFRADAWNSAWNRRIK